MAITVTPKYKPFTYDELVKPFDNYWEDYDKSEEQLDTLSNSVSTLKSVIESLPEGEEKQKYTNFLSAIGTNSDSLANNGLTASVRQALRDLKNQYAVLVPRLDAANKAYKKDLALEQSRINSGEYFVDTDHGVRQYSPIDYMDGNIPEYHAGISKKELGADVMNVAKSYSSRIFKGMSPEKVRRIGQTFLKFTQEQGVNADISSIAGNEQFKPILDELYNEYGVNNMNSTDQTAVKDFINRKFWEGLVYKKAEDYQQMKIAAAARNPSNNITPLNAVTPDGRQLVQVGGRTMVIDGKTENGNLIVTPVPNGSDIKEANEKANFTNNLFIGYDNYNNKNVYNTDKKVKKMDEKAVSSAYNVINNFIQSGDMTMTNKNRATFTNIVLPSNLQAAYIKSLKNLDAETKTNIEDYNINFTDFIGFHTGGGNELLGDNHIRLIPANRALQYIIDSDSNYLQKYDALSKIGSEYSNYNSGRIASTLATEYLIQGLNELVSYDLEQKKWTVRSTQDEEYVKSVLDNVLAADRDLVENKFPGLWKNNQPSITVVD